MGRVRARTATRTFCMSAAPDCNRREPYARRVRIVVEAPDGEAPLRSAPRRRRRESRRHRQLSRWRTDGGARGRNADDPAGGARAHDARARLLHDQADADRDPTPTGTPTPTATPQDAAAAEQGADEDVSSDELAISLEAVDEFCDMSDDYQGSARVRWSVGGGRGPYEVWVNGELQTGESGVVDAPCVGLRWVDFRTWQRTLADQPLTVVGTVIDAEGVRASDLLLIKRPPAHSIARPNQTQAFEGGVDTLTLELFAPRICDAQVWGRSSRIPFADTGSDDVTMEVEWRVSGGQPPYAVYLAGGVFEGDSGTLRVQCRHFEDGALDSGWLSVMGFVRDSEGAIGSGIVETFALARAATKPGAENYQMNGGRTYRLEGILMRWTPGPSPQARPLTSRPPAGSTRPRCA